MADYTSSDPNDRLAWVRERIQERMGMKSWQSGGSKTEYDLPTLLAMEKMLIAEVATQNGNYGAYVVRPQNPA